MNKRLFFAAKVEGAWPERLPDGRILDEKVRHITLDFLGPAPTPDLGQLPKPDFPLAPAGFCTKWALLKHVAAAEVQWLTGKAAFLLFQKKLHDWLLLQNYRLDDRPFFPHITAARAPLDRPAWEKAPCQVPFFLTGVHLYESLGGHTYIPLWGEELQAPFSEIEHTADIAFVVRGENLYGLFLHAQLALAFKFPQLVSYFRAYDVPASLDDLILRLNDIVAAADQETGCPFKAVSYHGQLTDRTNHLEWTMIVDV